MQTLKCFHLSAVEIRMPDLQRGRRNADFGQGFYLSTDRQFSERWADTRPGAPNVLNLYTLRTQGLQVVTLQRDAVWFDYVTANRAGGAEAFPQADVIIGPIANDTIYDTWGILTSGLVQRAQALALLCAGPEYRQIAIKTPAAAAQLEWRGVLPLEAAAVAEAHAQQLQEEAAYQALIRDALGPLTELLD